MSTTVTAWRLSADATRRRSARCLLVDRSGHWDVIVWNGPSIVLWERVETERIARARADEYWALMVSHGWLPAAGEPEHTGGGPEPFRRTCPECGATAAGVTHRRNSFIVLACDACDWRGQARARTARGDRRQAQREQPDRRRAA